MNNNFHIWPKNKLKIKNYIRLNNASSNYIELNLRKKFNNQGYPVLVSSGRVGIILSLKSMGLKRNDYVKIFPYASHCVIESIAKIATPVSIAKSDKIKAKIIYHQHGFVQFNKDRYALIEDAIDSLLTSKGKIFPLNGNFEIWSLNKILGSPGGGIIWCKSKKKAELIKRYRDERKHLTNISWIVKLLSIKFKSLTPFWYGIESNGGPIPDWAMNQISKDIKRWDTIIEERKKRIEIIKKYIPKWLKIDPNRIPSALPIIINEKKEKYFKILGFSHGFRHFEKITPNNKSKLIKTFLVPVHQNIPIKILNAVKEYLEK